jgi:hypothetical protein
MGTEYSKGTYVADVSVKSPFFGSRVLSIAAICYWISY